MGQQLSAQIILSDGHYRPTRATGARTDELSVTGEGTYLLHNLGTADRVDLAWPYPFFIIFFPSSAAHHDMGVDIIELRPQIAPSAWLRSGQTL